MERKGEEGVKKRAGQPPLSGPRDQKGPGAGSKSQAPASSHDGSRTT